MSARTWTCEGCDAVQETPGRQMMPDAWTGYGASRFPKQRIAVWCPACSTNGAMERESQTTQAAAEFHYQRKVGR